MPARKAVVRLVGHTVTTVVAESIDKAIVSSERLSSSEKFVARVVTLAGRLAAHGLVEAAATGLED